MAPLRWSATVSPRLHSHPPRVPGMPPSTTRGPMSWSAGTQRNSPRQVPCRGLDLAGPGNLLGSEACRSSGPAGAHIAPRCVSCDATLSLERPSRQAPLAGVLMLWLGRPGKLLLPGPCLLGPASSSCRGSCLECLVSSWPEKGRGVSWCSHGWPCRGVLQLPVHKFGVLRYPYFSTPTGAPGLGHTRCRALLGQALTVHGHAWPWSRCSLTPHPSRLPRAARAYRGVVGAKRPFPP